MPLQTFKSMVTSQEAIPGFVRDTTTTFKHEHRSERNISGFCQITDVSKPNITKKEQNLSLLCKLFIFNQSMVSSSCLKCILLPREDGLINKILHGYIRHGNKGITDTRVKFFKCTLFQNDFRADPIAQVNSSLESTDSKNVT